MLIKLFFNVWGPLLNFYELHFCRILQVAKSLFCWFFGCFVEVIRGMLDMSLAWTTSGVASCNLTFLSIIVLRTFWRTTINCVVYSVFKKGRTEICPKHWINNNFSLYEEMLCLFRLITCYQRNAKNLNNKRVVDDKTHLSISANA